MSENGVVVAPNESNGSNSRTLPVDMLVLCTGWTAVSPLFSPSMASKLGLPTPVHMQSQQTKAAKAWSDLDDANDREILNEFSTLQYPPAYRHEKPFQAPYRLYHSMISLDDLPRRSFISLGKLVIGNHFRSAEIQALWAVAYLDGGVPICETKAKLAISRTRAWCRRRYLNKGEMGNWFFFDAIDYTDMLLAELRLERHQQKGWFSRFLAPCRASDLRGLVEEYISLYKSSEKVKD